MKKINILEIAEYIIESMGSAYKDGYYCIHYNPENGLNYKGNMDPKNISVAVCCGYADRLDRYEMGLKENVNDPDFMEICNKLTKMLNMEIEKLVPDRVRRKVERMKKYLVEFAFSENFCSVQEWQTIDGLDLVEAENAEEAAKFGACTDDLENALFRVCELVPDQFGGLEKSGDYQYFSFNE